MVQRVHSRGVPLQDGRSLWRRRPDGRLGVGLTLAVRHHGHGDVAGADREILRLLDHATAERNPSSIDRNAGGGNSLG